MHGGLDCWHPGTRDQSERQDQADSAPGQGTRLTVDVPIALEAGPPDPEAPEAPVSSPQEEYS
jgi:hypothetical protein